VLEFEYAKYGMTGLETTYAAVKTALPALNESRWVELVSTNPRKIFGLPATAIQKNVQACITIFEPGTPVSITATTFLSKSKNSAFTGKTLQGRVKGIINKETLFLN
jgi:dihydroorotase